MRIAAVLALAACGRLGFDETEPPASEPQLPSVCDAVDVGTVTLAGPPSELRVVELPGEYAVLVGTETGQIYALRVVKSSLSLASTHLPMDGGYTLRGGAALGDTVFVQTDLDADSYLKRLEPSWDTYGTAQSGSAAAIDPPLGVLPGGQTAMFANIATGTLDIFEVDALGDATGVTTGFAATATSASMTGTPTGARVAYGDGASCKTFAIDPAGVTGEVVVLDGCDHPHALAVGEDAAAIVHRAPGTASVLVTHVRGTAQPAIAIGSGQRMRSAVVGDEVWVAFDEGALHLARVPDAGEPVVRELAVPPPLDFSATIAFWFEGSKLRAGRPCLEP